MIKINTLHTNLLFAALLITLGGFAQQTGKKGLFNVGFEGGVQFTNIKGFSSLYIPNSKTGFSAGAVGEYYFSNSFKVFVGATYDNRKFSIDGQLPYLTDIIDDTVHVYENSYYLYQVDYSLNYLTIPFGIGYERGSEKFKILLKLNFYYSLFLNGTMDGGELYYLDPSDGADLSETILNQGVNEFLLTGNTPGIARTKVSRERTSEYSYENFNSFDFGVNFSIGVLYQVTADVGIAATVGFTYDMTNLFENPELESKWSAITKINLGVYYTIGRK